MPAKSMPQAKRHLMRQWARPIFTAMALIATTTTSLAQEDRGCLSRVHFNLNSQGPWPVYMDVKSGHQCSKNQWRAGGTTVFQMLYLVTKPQHGNVALRPHAHFTYSSKPGHVGKDDFTLRVCGKTQNRPACADLLVHVTVH